MIGEDGSPSKGGRASPRPEPPWLRFNRLEFTRRGGGWRSADGPANFFPRSFENGSGGGRTAAWSWYNPRSPPGCVAEESGRSFRPSGSEPRPGTPECIWISTCSSCQEAFS